MSDPSGLAAACAEAEAAPGSRTLQGISASSDDEPTFTLTLSTSINDLQQSEIDVDVSADGLSLEFRYELTVIVTPAGGNPQTHVYKGWLTTSYLYGWASIPGAKSFDFSKDYVVANSTAQVTVFFHAWNPFGFSRQEYGEANGAI